jgi:hypothetical protein
MNSYRKIAASRKNKKKKTMRKTLKLRHMLKRKQRKQKKMTYNNKSRKRYQIGCSRNNCMKGGGIGAFQGVLDSMNTISNAGTNLWNTYNGELPIASSNPTL